MLTIVISDLSCHFADISIPNQNTDNFAFIYIIIRIIKPGFPQVIYDLFSFFKAFNWHLEI